MPFHDREFMSGTRGTMAVDWEERIDVRRMREAGADGLLIGTAIMDGDPRENTTRFVNA